MKTEGNRKRLDKIARAFTPDPVVVSWIVEELSQFDSLPEYAAWLTGDFERRSRECFGRSKAASAQVWAAVEHSEEFSAQAMQGNASAVQPACGTELPHIRVGHATQGPAENDHCSHSDGRRTRPFRELTVESLEGVNRYTVPARCGYRRGGPR